MIPESSFVFAGNKNIFWKLIFAVITFCEIQIIVVGW